MNELIAKLRDALATANSLKTGERSEEQRRLAILCSKLEKAYAWALYTTHA